MAEQDLDDPGIDAILQQAGCIAVAQAMRRHPLCDARRADRIPEGASQNSFADRVGAAVIGKQPPWMVMGAP